MTVKIDMDMPKSCSVCEFCSFNEGTGCTEDYYECVISGQFLGIKPLSIKRQLNCPLQEVKE